MERDERVQVAERLLFDAEQAYREEPSEANRRRVMRAWSEVQAARGEPADDSAHPRLPFLKPDR